MPNIERMMPAASDKGIPMTITDAVRHRTKVASHTVVPLGTAKWLVWDYPPYNIACPWVGDMCCVCPLPKGKVPCVGIALTSHFAVPKGTAVWLATIV